MKDDYFQSNGYKKDLYTRPTTSDDEEDCTETILTWSKMFPGGYSIEVKSYSNFYGGKTVINVGLHLARKEDLPSLPMNVPKHRRMCAPSLSFFATCFDDFTALEKKIAEEIVPKLKSWAIPVI